MNDDGSGLVTRFEAVDMGRGRTITVVKVLWRHRGNGREMWCTPEVRPLPSNFMHEDEFENEWQPVYKTEREAG